jgi:hypothetical protein
VPLRRYEAFWDEYWRDGYPVLTDVTWPGTLPYFALSSGTTSGRTKYIPVSRAMVEANRDAGLDVLCWHLANHPKTRVLGGLSFMLGGSTALEAAAPGVRQGDLSGIAAAEVPAWARPWSWPPPDLALIADWDRKLAALAEATPVGRVRALSGTPSWLLMLFERLAARRGTPPLPALELLVHGGVAWGPYRDRTAAWLPPGCATREVYPASEGFFAIADRGEGEGMRLCLDRGCFFEFVPLEDLDAPHPTRHWAATIEPGVEYAVVVSTCAGLWAYVVGDTVRFVDRAPVPRLLVTGRTAYTLSAFGEHLSGEEIEAALLAAAREAKVAVGEYSVGPVFAGTTGHHRWLIEAEESPPDAAPRLAAALDAALCAANDDYRAHREGRQLGPPAVALLPSGAFAAWMRREGRLGGQHKVPRVVADPERLAAIAAALAPGSADGSG